jgi:hypothetical protein
MKYKSELKRLATQSKAVRDLVEENGELKKALRMLAELAETQKAGDDYSALRVRLDIAASLAKDAIGDDV